MPAGCCSKAPCSDVNFADAEHKAGVPLSEAPVERASAGPCEAAGASAGTSSGASHSAAAAPLPADSSGGRTEAAPKSSGRGWCRAARSSSASAAMSDNAGVSVQNAAGPSAAGSSCGASTAPQDAEAPGTGKPHAPAHGVRVPSAAGSGEEAAQQAPRPATCAGSAPAAGAPASLVAAAAPAAALAAAPAEAVTLASLSVEHLQRTGALSGEPPECRICLSAERPDCLVAACNCIGSMRFAHVDCLEVRAESKTKCMGGCLARLPRAVFVMPCSKSLTVSREPLHWNPDA